jgi:class 3 adenylate cyclase
MVSRTFTRLSLCSAVVAAMLTFSTAPVSAICADFLVELIVELRGFEPLTSAVRAFARVTASPLPRVNTAEGASSTHHGRVVKRTGDGLLVEFRSVVDEVRCAIEIQKGMVMRNAGLPPE